MKKSKAISAGIGYTVGNIFIKGINFLTVPLFSRLLTTEEFGVYNTFIAYDAILCIVMSFALYMSIRSANIEYPGKIHEYASSITLLYIIAGSLLLGIVFIFRDQLSVLLSFPKVVLYMLILYSFASGIITLYNQIISLEYNTKKYLLIAFVNSIGNIFLSLLLILTVFRNHKDLGRIIGVTSSMFGLAVLLLVSMYRKSKPRINRDYWRFGLHYSLPIVPHGVSQVLLSQFDRIMIRTLVSASATGIYSLAGNIKLILTIINDSIVTVWQTWFYEKMRNCETHKIPSKAIMLAAAFGILTCGMIAISPELIMFMGGSNYMDGKKVAIPMIVDAFIVFLYNIVVPAEYYKKKTNYIMWATLFAAILNIITNYIFILKYGYIAAAYTTLFAYICYLAIHYYISHKLIGFYTIPRMYLALLLAIVALVATISLVSISNVIVRFTVGIIGSISLFSLIVHQHKLLDWNGG